MTYYLEEYDLIKICLFNGIGNHYAFTRQSLDRQEVMFKERLFDKLLENNPKMKPFVDSFLKQYSEHYISTSGKPSPIEQIKTFWKNKLTIEDFSEAVLSSNYIFREDSDRLKFLKSLFEKSPTFLNIVHAHIQSSIHNKNIIKNNIQVYTHISDSIYDAYFQMLKSKLSVNIRKTLKSEAIKENIDSYRPDKLNSIKKKINAYLNNFTRDTSLYEHITKQLEDPIKNNGTIKLFWDDKINLFTPDVAKKHNSEKTEISWGESSSSYLYSFKLNPEFIVEKSHLTQNQSLYFRGTFHSAISNFLCKNFNGSTVSLNGGTYYSVHVIFNDLIDKNRASAFCDLVTNNIEHIITSYCKKESNSNINEQLNEYFKKLNLAFELDKKLESREKTTKPIKNKI